MDQAIYEPTTQKIFGVRGQWLFQFNATTGALEASLRFTSNAQCVSCITAFGGNLYCGVNNVPWNTYSGLPSFVRNDLDVFIVSAAGFSVTGRLNSFTNVGKSGFGALVNDGTNLYGTIQTGTLPNDLLAFKVLPSVPGGLTTHSLGQRITDMAYDSVNSLLWFSDPDFTQAGAEKTDFSNGQVNDTTTDPFCGCCYNSAQNKAYFVAGGEAFSKILATDMTPGFVYPTTMTTLHTGRINANPVRIKSVNNLVGNPLNAKVLIPTWADDAVVVWNPLTDTVDSVKTGFTAPFDIVSTPTKNFAVQTGTTALKEIL